MPASGWSIGLVIDSFVEADERVLWADRFNPARPRMRPVSFTEILNGEGKLLFAMGMLTLCALILAILGAGTLEGLLAAFAAIVLAPATVLYARRLARMLKSGTPWKCDYLLTGRRLLVLGVKAKAPEVLSVDRFVSVSVQGRTLIVQLSNPDDIGELRDLADIETAKRAFTSTLGPTS
jgi:hypothetical protein